MDASNLKLTILCTTILQGLAMALLGAIAITHDGASVQPITTALIAIAGGTSGIVGLGAIVGHAYVSGVTAKNQPAPGTVNVPMTVVPVQQPAAAPAAGA